LSVIPVDADIVPMKLDIVAYQGDDRKPAVVFIHGLGMDKDIWTNPANSRILGGMFPLKVLLKKCFPDEESENVRTLFDVLREKGYTVVTWSQRRPAGAIDLAVHELHEAIRIARGLNTMSIILVGHSRGGLIARKYLASTDTPVQALITLATPHAGSTVAGMAKYVSPLAAWLAPLVPKGEKGTVRFAVQRVLEFLRSKALRELLPESGFFKSLNDRPMEGLYYTSIGGTSPHLFTLFGIAVPDIFEKIVPATIFPEEMKQGKGDGLVSEASSQLSWCHEHHAFDMNHAEILFDHRVNDTLVSIIEKKLL
jgi:pimeloyl-ACP methyl ester carboxylesterase